MAEKKEEKIIIHKHGAHMQHVQKRIQLIEGFM